ncbi:MAG: hypothetical protein INQ03_20935 [Candidatus Heimdallarchaeota archaeon]|nr:hypothetical protein [Candidatus Heimdallarchaeota archaeon]
MAEEKTISIRGVDTKAYEEFSSKMKDAGVNIGKALSVMMASVADDLDAVNSLSAESIASLIPKKRINITGMSKISVALQDLQDVNARVAFNNIDELIFEEDITKEDFLSYISSINHCGIVRIPKVLPKLIVLSLVNYCDKLELYEVEQ